MPTLVGVFDAPGPVRTLAEKLQGRGFGELEIYSPSPFPELDDAIDKKPSRVRLFTLIGGLTGVTFGYWMQIWMANDWPLVIGGKPFTSVVPYTIIGFELMVLLGGLFTVLGLFAMARLPRFSFDKAYSARFSGEEIGLAVACRDRDVAEVEALLRDSEAKEVSLVEA
jgi:molybdopterin-containing oxidoreductase family membrane subunit